MTVVARRQDELTTFVDQTVRGAVLEALSDYELVTTESLEHAHDDQERARLRSRLKLVDGMRRHLEDPAQVQLTGPPDVVVEIVKTAASNVTNELDSLVESAASTDEPLAAEACETLHLRSLVASACVEALVACETGRRT